MTSGCLAAWAGTFDADPEPALHWLASALARIRETGQLSVEVMAMLLLASALGRAGRPDEGLGLAHAAGEIAGAEIPIHLAEARRLEAELQRRCGADADLVEALYDEAASVAAAQGSVLVARRVAWSRRHAIGTYHHDDC